MGRVWVVALVLGMLMAFAGPWTPLSAEGTAVVGSPHASPDGCLACHDAGTEPGVVGAPRPAVATCRGCHPTADMHAVGVVPVDTAVPHGWPLESAAVTCATCHAEPACDVNRPAERPFLRGGPYARPVQLCSRCHDAGALQRTNPHPAPGGVVPAVPDGSCAACHTGPPEEGASPEQSRLRGEAEQICLDCHPAGAHAGLADHLGARLDAAALQTLDGRLPLGAQGAIACWTCHDVHAPPASPPASASPGAGPGDARVRRQTEQLKALARGDRHPPVTHVARLALPVADGALCRACHGDGP